MNKQEFSFDEESFEIFLTEEELYHSPDRFEETSLNKKEITMEDILKKVQRSNIRKEKKKHFHAR